MFRRRATTSLIGAALAFAFISASCGGSATDPAPAEAPQAEAPPAAQVAPDPQPAEPAAEAAPATKTAPEPTAVPEPATAASARTGDEKLAPELTGINSWINSQPLTLEGQRGNVVLIDFWTYTCINCIRTLPYIKDWHEKYADEGLVIIGVHTPEFEFEKNRDNVVEFMGKEMLKYAVAQDNDYGTWRAFENRFWPAKYLIDKDGYIRYMHFGEGAYEETERKIRDLLAEKGAAMAQISLDTRPELEHDPKAASGDPLTSQTRELYAGYERNYNAAAARRMPPYIVQRKFYDEIDADTEYQDPGEHVNHFIYLHGLWRNGRESLTHSRMTENFEDYLLVKFFARTVNVVFAPEGAEAYDVRVTLDGKPVDATQAGADIQFDVDGNSFVRVDEPRMYRIVKIPEFGGYEMKLSSNSEHFTVFAYTFGSYMEEPEA